MKVESYFMDIMLKITNSFVCLNVFFPLTREGHWSQNMPWIVCQLLANFFHVSSNSTRSLSTRVSFWFPKWQIKLFIYFYFASLQIHCYIIKTMTKIEWIKITMMRRPKRNYVAYRYINLIGLLRYNFTRYYIKTINYYFIRILAVLRILVQKIKWIPEEFFGSHKIIYIIINSPILSSWKHMHNSP